MATPLRSRAFACAVLLLPTSVMAELVPHPTLPDRVIETRGAFVVEYSPGQEAWAEVAFQRLETLPEAESPAPSAAEVHPPAPGSASDFRARRDIYLAAVAARIGLDAPTELQARTFDTFVGHYAVLEETLRHGMRRGLELLELPPRRVTIWNIDDLKRRLAAGQVIPNFTYDAEENSGSFDVNLGLAAEQSPAVRAIREFITSQQLDHRFERFGSEAIASVRLGSLSTPAEAVRAGAEPTTPAPLPEFTYPVCYDGAFDAPVDPATFGLIKHGAFDAMREPLARQVASFRDAITAFIVLHETAEVGLIESIIASPDRRWLCDGTANYVASRVLHELTDPAFATRAYDLPSQLRRFASFQADIALARWPAAEAKDGPRMPPDLAKAHYAFATRAITMIAERHGDDAIARLWRDVARTPRTKATARTFAKAYRKRYGADLTALVRAAESDPIPPAR